MAIEEEEGLHVDKAGLERASDLYYEASVVDLVGGLPYFEIDGRVEGITRDGGVQGGRESRVGPADFDGFISAAPSLILELPVVHAGLVQVDERPIHENYIGK